MFNSYFGCQDANLRIMFCIVFFEIVGWYWFSTVINLNEMKYIYTIYYIMYIIYIIYYYIFILYITLYIKQLLNEVEQV